MQYVCDNARHLVCLPYSVENLHKMAEELGIKRCWFHKNHYDIPKRRIEEITAKCKVVSSQEIVRMMHGGDPQKQWDGMFQSFRTRPAMYLGKKSIFLFQAMMDGFRLAESMYNINDTINGDNNEGGFNWAGFEQYVAKKYNPRQLSLNSFGMAVVHSGVLQDEAAGFDKWFEWYDEYMATKS